MPSGVAARSPPDRAQRGRLQSCGSRAPNSVSAGRFRKRFVGGPRAHQVERAVGVAHDLRLGGQGHRQCGSGRSASAARVCSCPCQEVLEAATGVVAELPVRDDADLADVKKGQLKIDVAIGAVQNRFVIKERDVSFRIATQT